MILNYTDEDQVDKVVQSVNNNSGPDEITASIMKSIYPFKKKL